MLNDRKVTFALAVLAFALAGAIGLPSLVRAQTGATPNQSTPGQTAPNAQNQPNPGMKMWHGDFGMRGGFGMRGMRGGMDLMGATAQVTGLTPQELRTELQSGKTLAQIAEAKGKTADDVVKAARKQLSDMLDQVVTAGRITREQADAKLKSYDTAAPDAMKNAMNGKMMGGMAGGCGHSGTAPDGTKPTTPSAGPGLWWRMPAPAARAGSDA